MMRALKRAVAATALTLAGLAALAGAASADTSHHGHGHPGLVGDVTVIAPVDVDIIGNTINVLGVLDD